MKLVKSFSIYALTTFLNKGIGFLLLPVFTYYLTPHDYGTLSLINTVLAVATPFIVLQVRGFISVEYYRGENKNAFRNYFISALSNPLIAFAIVTILFMLGHQSVAEWLDIDPIWVMLVPVLALVALLPQVSQTIFQVSERPIAFGLFSLSKTGLELGISILLVVVFSLNYQGRLLGILITGVLFSLISFIILKNQKLFSGKIKKNFRKEALWFGLPLIPHAIGAIVMNTSDRFFIAKMVSVDELGIYSVGYAIGSIIMIIEHAFTQAWTPFFYKNLKINNIQSKRKIVSAGYGFMGILVLVLIIITFLTPYFFKYILDSNFSGGSIYVFWVGLGYLFLGFYKIFTGFIFYLKKTKILGYLSFVNVILNLLLNYFLIREYGALGAAYATVVSFFIFFLVVAILAQRMYPMPWLGILKRA